MTATYDRLAKSGALGSWKRDIVLEAVRDLEYVESVLDRFVEESGIVPESDRIPNTVRLIIDLVDGGWCHLATWGQPTPRVLEHSARQATELVSRATANESPFTYFLTATPKAKEWVQRYNSLIKELR